MPIDNKYSELGKNKLLDIFLINPVIVDPLMEDKLSSNINNLNIETFI
jgi:hypothetical protein